MPRVNYAAQADVRVELYLAMKRHLIDHHKVDGSIVNVMMLVIMARSLSDEVWHDMIKQLHVDAVRFHKEQFGNLKVM